MILKHHPIKITGALVLILICVIVVIYSNAILVRYHRYQMQQAWQDAFARPKVAKTSAGAMTYADDRSYEKFEYHRQKLVELGGIAERHYTFQHLLVHKDESKHFSGLLFSHQSPSYIDFSSEYPNPDYS
jgi:hypothetical protein